MDTLENAGDSLESHRRPSERYSGIAEVDAPAPVQNDEEDDVSHQISLEPYRSTSERYSGIAEVDAPAPVQDEQEDGLSHRRSFLEDDRRLERVESLASIHKHRRDAKEWISLLSALGWLIFYSIWGALARLGISAITIYPGSPIAGLVWANFAGCFVMGFMAEEVRFFAAVPASRQKGSEKLIDEKPHWSDDKKGIPLYIGITTGFCGSLTSFSSWMRDSFFGMANIEPSYPRNKGYNVEALLAQIIATTILSLGGLKVGAHTALLLRPIIPTMPKQFRPHLDILGCFLGPALWIGIMLMAIFIPKWRGIALFAGVFAPFGAIIRFFTSKQFNPMLPSFPLGTFIVNVGGSMIDSTLILLQHYSGVNTIGCEVLRGLEDGFCGCLTTVSTWAVELTSLRRMYRIAHDLPPRYLLGNLGLYVLMFSAIAWIGRHAYKYGLTSILCGFASFVIILGSYTWDHGLDSRKC